MSKMQPDNCLAFWHPFALVFSQLVSLSLRLRNGVKYCKVLRLPEVSKSTLFLIFLSAAAV